MRRAAFLLLSLISVVLVESRTIDEKLSAAFGSDTTEDGDVIVEYDMVYKRDVYERRRSDDLETRKATRRTLWTNGVIPYTIQTADFSAQDIETIKAAMRDWEAQTCLTFRPKTASDPNYIFIKQAEGCNSYVGMYSGGQRVSLDTGCRGKDTVIHELGHALGFEHEHQRPDRDGYITVVKDNIEEKWAWALDKMEWADVDAHGIPYDYSSIMHYGQTAFGKNKPNGEKMRTIETKVAGWQYFIGTGELPSFYDFKMANLIYQCAAKCPAKTCRDEGYMDKSCNCQCKGWPVHSCDDGSPDGNGYDNSFVCEDKHADCASFVKYGYCKDSVYTPFMEGNCRKACGFC